MNIKAFILKGTSMWPVFLPGEPVFVDSTAVIRAGDCVVYDVEGKKLLHRVSGVSEKGAFIEDDAGTGDVHFVPKEQIDGRVLGKGMLAGGFLGFLYGKAIRNIHKFHRFIVKS